MSPVSWVFRIDASALSMKYVILHADGLADRPRQELGGKTQLGVFARILGEQFGEGQAQGGGDLSQQEDRDIAQPGFQLGEVAF